jgi:hypothetical protein
VLFSCKITHSVLNYLDRRGEDLESFYENCDWPAEFLHDPSSWLEADKMENILRMIDESYGHLAVNDESCVEPLNVTVGHQCKDLRGWGVLDSVLRMVQTPKDLFAQPERFLSYFVSPAPPIGELRRESEQVSFITPISELQFPLVTGYLRAALEALPSYISKPMATVTWDKSRVTISWSEGQASLFGEAEAKDLSIHPDLVRNILHDLESSQKQIEEMKRLLTTKDEEIEVLRTKNASVGASAGATSAPEGNRAGRVLHDLYRLGDYIARGQQLITLLIGQGRQTPQVKEAMRRVDWEFVAVEGPQLVRRAVAELQELNQPQPIKTPSAAPTHTMTLNSHLV